MRDPSLPHPGVPGLSPPIEGWMGLKVGGKGGSPCPGVCAAGSPSLGTLPQLSPVPRLADPHQLPQAPPEKFAGSSWFFSHH